MFSTITDSTFLVLIIIRRDSITNVYGLRAESTGYLVRFLTKLVFSRQIFAEFSNIKFHENP